MKSWFSRSEEFAAIGGTQKEGKPEPPVTDFPPAAEQPKGDPVDDQPNSVLVEVENDQAQALALIASLDKPAC